MKKDRTPSANASCWLAAAALAAAAAAVATASSPAEDPEAEYSKCDRLPGEDLRVACYFRLLFPPNDRSAPAFPAQCRGAAVSKEREWAACGNNASSQTEWFCADTCECIGAWRGCGDRCMPSLASTSRSEFNFYRGCARIAESPKLAARVPLYFFTICRGLLDLSVNQVFEQDLVPCPRRDEGGQLTCVFGHCNTFDGERACPGLRGHDRRSCEAPPSPGLPDECHPHLDHCRGRRPRQCFLAALQRCDGRAYDCMDLSDEIGCDDESPEQAEPFRALPEVPQYSLTKDHGEPLCHDASSDLRDLMSAVAPCVQDGGGHGREAAAGFRLGSAMPCVPAGHFCGGRAFSDDLHNCPNLERLATSDLFCLNGTLLHDAPCGVGGTIWTRCRGNAPWQCAPSRLEGRRGGCDCPDCRGLCADNSHLICDREEHPTVCSAGQDMRMCGDNRTCAHESLYCDGYAQCPDGSDEDVEICGRCDRDFGYSKSGDVSDASYSCRHRYTNRTICAVPCNGEDDLCRDMEDERHCDTLPRLVAVTFPALAVVVAAVGELSYHFFFKKHRNGNSSESEQQESRLIDLFTKLRQYGNEEVNGLSKKEERRVYNLYKVYRRDQPVSFLLLAFQGYSRAATTKIFGLINKFEINRHRGDRLARDKCLKEDLGSSRLAQHFYDVIEPGIVNKLANRCASSSNIRVFQTLTRFNEAPIVPRLKIYARFLLTLSLYYADLAKDVFIIILTFRLSGGQTSSFPFAVGTVLAGSLFMTELANIIYFNLKMMRDGKSWRLSSLLSLLAFPLMPAVISVQIARQSLINHAITTDGKRSLSSIRRMDKHLAKKLEWQQLLASTRRNENILEHPFPFLIPTAAVLLQHSSTSTFSGLQRLFSERALPFLVLSSAWSLLSMVRGAVRYEILSRHGHMGVAGRVLLASYYLTTSLARMSAIFLYFVPSTGVLDVLRHWKHGKIAAGTRGVGGKKLIYDVDFSVPNRPRPIEFREVWERTADYTHYTGGVGFSGYAAAFSISCLLHVVLMFFLKRKQPEAARMGRVEFGFHLLECLLHPKPLADWDSAAAESFESAWSRQKKEIRSILSAFAVEHMLMCIPMWILLFSVTERNMYLEEYFPPIPAALTEATARITVLSVAPPLLFCTLVPASQYCLLMLYYKFGQPWASIFVAEQDRIRRSRKQSGTAVTQGQTLELANV